MPVTPLLARLVHRCRRWGHRWGHRVCAGALAGVRLGLRALWQWPLALLILFEEWGWEPLQQLLARIGRWPGLRWVEGWLRGLPPYAALAVLLLPSLLLLPIKLLALWAIAHGHSLLGLLVIVAAKLGGTALLARLFSLTQPALLQLAWFARWHARWLGWKDALLQRVRHSAAWQLGRQLAQHVANRLRQQAQRRLSWLRQHWQRWTRGPRD